MVELEIITESGIKTIILAKKQPIVSVGEM